jgi:NIPSNAP
MKTITVIFLLSLLIISCTELKTEEAKVKQEYYQLKTYTFDNPEQVEITDKFLKDAYMPALKKLNINNIGVFKLRPSEKDSSLKTFILLPFQSIDQFYKIETQLKSDSVYLKAGAEYFNTSYKAPAYKRIESTLMIAFQGMPGMRAAEFDNKRSERVYELRSYGSANETYFHRKIEMFHSGEIDLFKKLGFNAVFYGEVISGSKMPNLMYMTTFEDQASREEHWDAFKNSPEWKELKSIPKYANTVSIIEIMFLYPTEYSDY